MLKAGYFVIAVAFLLFVPILGFAQETDMKGQFDQIKSYAEQYEAREITYLQLKVQAESIGEKIRRSVSNGFFEETSGEKKFEGLKTEAIESLLGQPTELTSHIWIVNEDKAEISGKELPGWRKEIFSGNKIKITVNAWPQIFRSPEGDKIFYWLGFEVFFKRELNIDPVQISSNVKSQVERYYSGQEDVSQVAKSIVSSEKLLQSYLEENKDKCVETAEKLVGGDKTEQRNKRTRGIFYSGKNINVMLDSNGCADCKDWTWFDINSWIEASDRSYMPDELGEVKIQEEEYKSLQLNELYFALENNILSGKKMFQMYDSSKYPGFPNDYAVFKSKMTAITREINEKVNSFELSAGDRERTRMERDDKMERMLEKHLAGFKTEFVKQVENKKRLLTIKEVKTDTHCETKFQECGPDMMCTAGPKCVQRPQEDKECAGPKCFFPQQGLDCVPMWEDRNSVCIFDSCGGECRSGSGPNCFFTKEECENKLSRSTTTGVTSTTVLTDRNDTTITIATTTTANTTITSSTTTTGGTTSTTASSTTSTTTGPTGAATGFQIADDNSCVKNGCNQNQVCNAEKGWCECSRGSFECDGDWRNGCESDKQCSACNIGDQCAPPRCEPGGGGIERFVCVQGEPREEDAAGFEMGAGCGFKQSGEPDAWVWFGGFGDKFEKLEQYKRASQSNTDWCERELSSALKERKEIEKSFKSDFLNNFMKDFVAENPEDFEIYGRSFGAVYGSIVENNRKIAENLQCLHKTEWPDAEPINTKIETSYGKIEIFEKFVETNQFGERMNVLSPYMKMWMFPPKEVFKKFFFEDIRKGKLGPDEDKGGPSPAEVAEMKQNKEVMATIQSISNRFGGEANIVFSVRENDQEMFKMLMRVNPDIIMDIKPVLDYTGEVDATLSIDFDYFYEMISSMEKGKAAHEEKPPWDNTPPSAGEALSSAADGIAFFTGIMRGLITGKVSVSPVTSWVNIILSFTDLLKMMQMAGS